jgi:acyl-[acyl-carrier-protein]-phospholipid O-acyltransferase / long-chain-fatty-acid--[acyl-carrier-protein] ligase
VVSLPDPKKGEQLVLLTTHKGATAKLLMEASEGVAPINLPKKVFVLDKLPALATGKVDYPASTKLAAELMQNQQ